jgi:hypothetical protein
MTTAAATTSFMPWLHIVVPVLAHVLDLASRLGLHFPEFPPLPSSFNSNHHDCRFHTPLD